MPHEPVPAVAELGALDDSVLSSVERLGLGLYLRYAMAGRARDALVSDGHTVSDRTEGWIAVPRGELWLIRFVDAGERAPFDVFMDARSMKPRDVEIHRPPAPLSPEELAMWRARQLALSSGFRACSPSYAAVVVPEEAEHPASWIVYLLAESTQADQVMLGGHHRIRVSADGSKLLAQEPLTRSCMSTKLVSVGTTLGVTHVLSQQPIETHVFLSLLHGVTIGVATGSGLWLVEGGRIRPLGAADE